MNAQRIESLIKQAESLPDAEARACAIELLQSLLELHGSCLERLVELISQRGIAGQEILDACGRDEAVSALLLLYDLHPRGLKQRVNEALEKMGGQLHGSTIELISIDEGVVRLRVSLNGHGCQSTNVKTLINDAIIEAAPDIADLVIDEIPAETKPVFVKLERLPTSKVAVGG